jgi:hypothetical protein
MAHTTFRNDGEAAWKDMSTPKVPGPTAADSKVRHSSTGPEREMRREMTHSEEQARAKHTKQDAQQHPGFANPTKGMP